MKKLFLIPARGGSKGLPGKNVKKIKNKALINHSIDFARKFTNDSNICVSTDSNEIIKCVEENNFIVDFKRPTHLAGDKSSMYDVIKHAINFYLSKGIDYDIVILLQPTTPFRKVQDLSNMISMWDTNLDLLVSVKESKDSPYFNLFEEDSKGFIVKSKESNITRRQDSPKIYSINGSIYLFNVSSILSKSFNNFNKIKKYIMYEPIYSIDIDSEIDYILAKALVKENFL